MQKLTYSKKWPKFILAQKYLQMCSFIFEFDACDIYLQILFFWEWIFFCNCYVWKSCQFLFFGHEITFNLKIQLLIEKECPPCFATQHCPSKKFPIHYICNILNPKCAQPLLLNVKRKCSKFWYLLCTKCAIKLYFSNFKSVPNFQYLAPSWSKMANCAIGNM